MRRFPPRDEPPPRRPRRDLPRSEGPFDRLLRRRPERDPAPIIIGGTVAFLAVVIVLVFVFSSVFGGGGGGSTAGIGGSFDTQAGIKGQKQQLPGLPPGLVSVSDYVEFDAKQDAPVNIRLELKDTIQDRAGLGFYTFFEGRWQRLAEAKLLDGGKVAEADFPSVPRNLAVLRVVAQTYQVAASLPHDGTLHADARVDILSPRDYSPAGDGSVQGSATKVPTGGKFLLMPTIIGSGQDTAAAVNDILKDAQRRAKHVEAIASLVQKGGFDGVDIEYSAVNADLNNQFTDFIKGLADSLHRGGKRLSITLPPPSNQRSAYDWKLLGEAVDIIKVLPIADPVSYWETMPGALGKIGEDVDPRKVMLVISPFSMESGGTAKPIGYLQAMALAAESTVREPNPADIKPGVTVRLVARNLDEGEGASPIRWNNDAAALSFALGGTERRRIFIENSFSFAFKIELAQAYGLAGVAVSDASAQSDVANVWPAVNELVSSATVTLRRPNDNSLLPMWQATEGGDLGAGAGTTATWIAPKSGQYNVILVVSDGERRFGRQTLIEVKAGNEASPTPLVTFPPESTPTTGAPSATPAGSSTPTPAATGPRVEVGLVADGDGDGTFSNQETAPPGGPVKYLVTIDNDGADSVTIRSLLDSVYATFECLTEGGQDVNGMSLKQDDGDGPGAFNGGPDEVKCTFTKPAPATPETPVHSFITVVVQDATGRTATDQDDTTITTR